MDSQKVKVKTLNGYCYMGNLLLHDINWPYISLRSYLVGSQQVLANLSVLYGTFIPLIGRV